MDNVDDLFIIIEYMFCLIMFLDYDVQSTVWVSTSYNAPVNNLLHGVIHEISEIIPICVIQMQCIGKKLQQLMSTLLLLMCVYLPPLTGGLTKANDAKLWSAPEQTFEQTI